MMVDVLSDLGVPVVIQKGIAKCVEVIDGKLIFNYGNKVEVYSKQKHTIPTTTNLWISGEHMTGLVTHIVIAYSAMECIAFLTLNQKIFKDVTCVCLVSTGLRPSFTQAKTISEQYPSAKKLLVFGKDCLGALSDITIAAGIQKIPAAFTMRHNDCIQILFKSKSFILPQGSLTLNKFQIVSKTRFNARTYKPSYSVSFLNLLLALRINSASNKTGGTIDI